MKTQLKIAQLMAIVIIQLMIITPLASAVLIQGVNVEVTGSSAVITWTTTEPTTTIINYGDTTLKENSVSNTNLLEEHTMEIVGLGDETKYYYDIVAEDSNGSGTEYSSSFITADITPPPKVSGIVNGTITETSIELLWAHVNVVDFNHYNVFRDGVNIHNVTSISYIDNELIAGMSYTYNIIAVDDNGNIGESSEPFTISTLAPDITGPAIFNISILALTDSTATIGWNTDEESNSIINYGTDESSLGLSVTDLALVTEHSLVITGLTKDIRYMYVVQSCDEAGNCDDSEPLAFTAGADYTPPFINATIPEYYNGLEIDFDVFTENHSDVLVYVNDIYRRSGNSGAEGKISFRNVNLDSVLGTNEIRIEAVDQIGNEAVQNYNIELDFVAPVLEITTNVTNLTTERSITIQGNVDELSTIKFFLELDPFDTTPPEKVTELVAEGVETNKIELEWKKSIAEDFNYYLIYREDVGLLATSTTENYKDENVAPGITYNYWVAAVDTDCISGVGSDVLAVKTQEDEETVVEVEIESVIAECDITSPEVELETSGHFSEKINLRKGINKINVEVTDKAGNKVVWEAQTIHDTDAPKFVSDNINALDPSYSEYVTITGQVSEPSTVYVYINERAVPDHFTETDNQGNFAVEVKLRKDEKLGRDSELRWRNKIILMAVDIAGLNGTTDEKIIEFSRCGGGNMDWVVSLRDLYPDSLVPRLLLEGMGQFTLGVDLEWQGAGAEPKTFSARPTIKKLDMSIEEKVHYDEEYLRPKVLMPDRKARSLTVLVDINALPDPTPAGENWTSYDKEDNISKMHAGECFSSSALSNVGINALESAGCIRAPLELTLKYRCEEYDSHGYLQDDYPCEQKECIFVDMLIEPRIDPDKMFNKGLLKAMVGFLNTSINAINAVLGPLETVSKITMAGCAVGWALLTVKKVSEFKSCYVPKSLKEIIANQFLDEVCKSCEIVDGSVVCPIGDDDIKDKCESCINAKANTLKFERGMHLVCDRVFCPSVPSYESYIEKNSSKVCSDSEVPNNPSSYSDALARSKESKIFSNTRCDICEILPDGDWCKSEAHKSECCAVDYMNQWGTGALFMNEMKESACVAVGDSADPSLNLGCNKWGNFIRGVRNFKLCKGGITEEITTTDGDYILILNKTGEGDVAVWGMYLARNFEYTTKTSGGTQETKSERIIIGNLSELLTRIEHDKCEGIKKGKIKYNSLGWPRYEVGGIHERTEVETRSGSDAVIITNITTNPEQRKVPIPIVNFICEDYEVKEDYIIDPATGLLKSVQAVCLPGVNSYLKQTKQIMELFQGCFNTILVTGDGSSGMCQHLVSQYICDIIYYAISCVKKLVPQGDGIRAEGGIKGFGKHLLSSVQGVQSGISGRYGTSRNFRAFFTGKQLVHSVCMAMFGADIDFNFDSLLDMGVDIPTDPFVMASGTRRFVGYDVTTGWSSHLYNIAPVIIAGEDMKYWIELVCSNDFSCEPSDGFEGGKCDCAEEALNCRVDGCTRGVTRIFGSGRLSKGEVLNTEEFISVEPPHQNSKYRFDKVRIRYESILGQDARAGEESSRRGGTKEFKIRPIGGNAPVHCYFRWGATDPGFRCDFYMDERGSASFTNPRGESVTDISDTYYLGDKIMNNSELSYVFKTEGKGDDGELIPIYLVGELKNQNGAVVLIQSASITEEGYHDYNMNDDIFNYVFEVKREYFEQTASAGGSGNGSGHGEYGTPGGFKVPLPAGYPWEVSQSWAKHCHLCLDKGYTDWSYCSSDMSHMGNCCKYSWDFNLPRGEDKGKSVLATADGTVRTVANDKDGWGHYLVIDHGNDICSRYAHLQTGSITVQKGQAVCQGLKLAQIGNTGNSEGYHLHFQFENCITRESLAMGFTDGNDVPVCTRGKDVMDSNGNYNFLHLTNKIRHDCSAATPEGSSGNSKTLPSKDCTTTAVPWTLTLGLYPSDDFGDIDMSAPFEVNEKEQKITFNLKAKCIKKGDEVKEVEVKEVEVKEDEVKEPEVKELKECTSGRCNGADSDCNCSGELTTAKKDWCFEGTHKSGKHTFATREDCLCGNHKIDSEEICDFNENNNKVLYSDDLKFEYHIPLGMGSYNANYRFFISGGEKNYDVHVGKHLSNYLCDDIKDCDEIPHYSFDYGKCEDTCESFLPRLSCSDDPNWPLDNDDGFMRFWPIKFSFDYRDGTVNDLELSCVKGDSQIKGNRGNCPLPTDSGHHSYITGDGGNDCKVKTGANFDISASLR